MRILKLATFATLSVLLSFCGSPEGHQSSHSEIKSTQPLQSVDQIKDIHINVSSFNPYPYDGPFRIQAQVFNKNGGRAKKIYSIPVPSRITSDNPLNLALRKDDIIRAINGWALSDLHLNISVQRVYKFLDFEFFDSEIFQKSYQLTMFSHFSSSFETMGLDKDTANLIYSIDMID